MTWESRWISVCCAMLVIPVFAAPPPPSDPVGGEAWRATGQYPDRLWLERKDTGRGLVIPHPYRDGFPGFGIMGTQGPDKEEWGLCLHIGHARQSFVPLECSLYVPAGKYFDLVNGDVIPIYDQLYEAQVRKKQERIILTRVTDKVAEEFRPAARSQTYSLGEKHAELFWEPVPGFDDIYERDALRLTIDKSTKTATVELTPSSNVTSRGGAAAAAYRTSRKPLTLKVAKGDLLTARGRSYKVLNVVPPQQIKLDGIVGGNGVGNLVGWIEISADPVEVDEHTEATTGRPK